MRKWFALLIIAFACAGFWHGSLPTPGTMTWAQVPIGAGGQLYGPYCAPDGTCTVRTDAYGAYVRPAGGTTWNQLFTSTLKGDLPNSPGGAWDATVAPSQTTRLLISTQGYVYISDNGSAWHQTAFPRLSGYSSGGNTDPNGNYKFSNYKLVIDPANPNVIYEGTNNNGLQVSYDGAVTAAQVSGVTASVSGPGNAGIVIDPNSGTTTCPGGIGLCTNVVFVGVFGYGVWKTANGGTTWTQIADGTSSLSPVNVWDAHIAPDGAYWATDHASVWKCAPAGCDTTGSGWTKITNAATSLGGTGYTTAAVPNMDTTGAVVFFLDATSGRETNTNNGTFVTDTFGCNAWTYGALLCTSGDGYGSVTATDIPWIGGTTGGHATLGGATYDALNHNYLIANGVGLYTATIATTTHACGGSQCMVNVNAVSQSVQVEELVTRDAIVPPGGNPIIAAEDRPAFYVTSSYPSAYYPNSTLGQATAVDYASSDPTFVCVRAYDIIDSLHDTGCSTNSGNGSWSLFSTGLTSDSVGGTIAVADHNNIIVNTGQGGALECTVNGGSSWVVGHVSGGSTQCQGIPASGWNVSGAGYTGIVQNLCADRVNVGTFYGYYWTSTSSAQLYTTTSLASAWTQAWTGTPLGGATTGGSTRLRCEPHNAGHLWFAGQLTSFNSGHYFLTRSFDGGVTWTTISKANGFANDVTSLSDFGFGAIASGKSFPRLWIYGYVDAVFGFWYSDDEGQSWTKPTSDPAHILNTLDFVYGINGDETDANNVYIVMGGSGAWKGRLNYLLKRDLDPAANDNSPAFLKEAG